MAVGSGLKVAIFTGNPKGIYSGGRYLSLILAYSLSRAGAEVTYVTDHLPMFDADFAPYDKRFPIGKIEDPRLAAPALTELDWVIVIPTGGVSDAVYDAGRRCATAAGARIALLSFETPNWFNALSPFKRNALPWEAWRRMVAPGGLVLTIAREGVEPARQFYDSPEHPAKLTYGYWHPPLNDLVANKVRARAKRETVVTFMRTQDPHKGALDLLRVDPEVLRDRKLTVIFGRGIDTDYLAAMQRHFSGAGVLIDAKERISDAQKFALLAGARLLLFPTYFEGFGYPVVEAAYMGVPSVAYDLPVLRETVGDAATYVPPGDTAAFSAAIEQALRRTPGPDIRAEMKVAADTLSAGRRACELLAGATDLVPPLATSKMPRSRIPTPQADLLEEQTLKGAWQRRGQKPVFESMRAVLNEGVIKVSGRVSAPSPDSVLHVSLAGAHVPPLATKDIPGSAARFFEMTGALPPVFESPPTEVEVLLSDQKRTVATAVVPVEASAEFLFGTASWKTGEEKGGLQAASGRVVILLSEHGRLLDGKAEALAVAEIASRFRRSGAETRLILRGEPTLVRMDQIETDTLPLADHVETFSTDAEILSYVNDPGHAGQVIVAAPEDIFPLASAPASLLVQCRALDGSSNIVVGAVGGERSAQLTVDYRPDLTTISRGELLRRNRLALVLSGGEEDRAAETLRYVITDVLPRVGERVGPVRVVVHRPLVGRAKAPGLLSRRWLPPGWTISTEDLRGAARIVQEAGAAIVLDLGGAKRDAQAQALADLCGAAIVPVRRDGEIAGEIADGFSTALTRSDTASSLADALVALGGGSPSTLPPRGLAASWGVTGDAYPPLLEVGEAISLTATDTTSDRYLVTGWGARDTLGGAMAPKGSLLAFLTSTVPTVPVTLHILVRSRVTERVPLTFDVTFNERRFETVKLPAPGIRMIDLVVPPDAWRLQGPQSLLFHAEPVEVGERKFMPHLVGVSFSKPVEPVRWDAIDPDRPIVPVARAAEEPEPGAFFARWTFDKDSQDTALLSRGWSHPEGDGTWSEGEEGGIVLSQQIAVRTPLSLRLRARMLVTDNHPQQTVIVSTADAWLAELRVSTNEYSDLFVALPRRVAAAGLDSLHLRFPNAVSPLDLGVNEDSRALAMQLSEVEIASPCGEVILGEHLPQSQADGGFSFTFAGPRPATSVLRLRGSGVGPCLVITTASTRSLTRPLRTKDGWILFGVVPEPSLDVGLALASRRAGDHFEVSSAEIWPITEGGDLGADVAFGLDLPRTILESGDLPDEEDANPNDILSWHFSEGGKGQDFLISGWSHPEPAFTWSDGQQAAIELPVRPRAASPIVVGLEASAFTPEQAPLQPVHVWAQGRHLGSSFVGASPTTTVFAVDAAAGGASVVTLELPKAISPHEVDDTTADRRRLAIALRSANVWLTQPVRNAKPVPCAGDRPGWTALSRATAPSIVVVDIRGRTDTAPSLITVSGSGVFHEPRVEGNEFVVTLPVQLEARPSGEVVLLEGVLSQDGVATEGKQIATFLLGETILAAT